MGAAKLAMRTHLLQVLDEDTGVWKTVHREHTQQFGTHRAPHALPHTTSRRQKLVGPSAQAQAEVMIQQLEDLLSEHSWAQQSPPGHHYGDMRMTMHTRLRAAEALMIQRGQRLRPQTAELLAEAIGRVSIALRGGNGRTELEFWEDCESSRVMQLYGGCGGLYRDFGCQPGMVYRVRCAVKLEQPVGSLQLSIRAAGMEDKMAQNPPRSRRAELMVQFRTPPDCWTFRAEFHTQEVQGALNLSGLLIEDLGTKLEEPLQDRTALLFAAGRRPGEQLAASQPQSSQFDQAQLQSPQFRERPSEQPNAAEQPWKLCRELTQQNAMLKGKVDKLERKQAEASNRLQQTNRIQLQEQVEQLGQWQHDERVEAWMQTQLEGMRMDDASGHYDMNRSR